MSINDTKHKAYFASRAKIYAKIEEIFALCNFSGKVLKSGTKKKILENKELISFQQTMMKDSPVEKEVATKILASLKVIHLYLKENEIALIDSVITERVGALMASIEVFIGTHC